jgi:predicted extracellular nuclease
VSGNYFYQVLDDGTLKIRDVQYSPLGSGYSSYNGYYVTLSGTVTADTSDIPGFYPPTGTATPLRVYMQDGSGPWTGIMIGTDGIYGADVLKLKRGDNVTVTGRIMESYGVTEIDSLTGSPIVSTHNNPLPQSITLTTDTIGKKFSGDVYAEQWESVLINYKNVTVTDENADGDPGPNAYNFGEIYVNDGTGDARVELQDGNHNYHNDWDSTLFDNPLNKYVSLGSYFSEIRGILFYSHGYYKLVPRQNDDFMGFITGIKKQNKVQPSSYTLEQNYPNPFNPTTKINYSITKSNVVTLKIYNILGQLVRTLVNQHQAQGAYTVTFNATNLSSGVYFYMLKAGNFTSVKKMILLK